MEASLVEWSRRRKVFTLLAAPSVVGALLFTIGWLVAGAIQDRYNPRSDYISSLAAVDAASPWIMIGALVTFGIGIASLGAGLVFTMRDKLGRAGSLGVLLSGIGVVFIGVLRHDCGVQLPACSAKVSMGEISSFHALHDVASGATFVLAGASQLLISRSVRRMVSWRYLRLPSFVSGIVTLVLFVLMNSEPLIGWAGALQRGIAIIASVWVVTLAVHLYRLGARSRPPESLTAFAMAAPRGMLTARPGRLTPSASTVGGFGRRAK